MECSVEQLTLGLGCVLHTQVECECNELRLVVKGDNNFAGESLRDLIARERFDLPRCNQYISKKYHI